MLCNLCTVYAILCIKLLLYEMSLLKGIIVISAFRDLGPSDLGLVLQYIIKSVSVDLGLVSGDLGLVSDDLGLVL